MYTKVIYKGIENRHDELKRFKVSVCNAHNIFFSKIANALSTEEAVYFETSDKEKWQDLYDAYNVISADSASKILSVIGVLLDRSKISSRDATWDAEEIDVYPYPEVWKALEKLTDDRDFFVGVLSAIKYVNYGKYIEEFYQNIIGIVRDVDLGDIYSLIDKENKVFVAMWFDEKMNKARKHIEDAIIACGYEATFIDQKEHVNQIVPEIFYEIKKCKLLVADLTGHRGGVYYEAGYAEALDKNVILTCSADETPHFDVAQKNTIFWKSPEDLQERLYKRIKAIL